MTELGDTGFPTLVNWAAERNPDGSIANVVNTLSKVIPEIMDIPWKEANGATGHTITQTANTLPSGEWRSLNAGVSAEKSTSAQYIESCGILESESKVDVDLAKLNGDEVAYRASQDRRKQEGMGQEFAESLWYESTSTNPERIHGLSPRYGLVSGGTTSSYVLQGTTGAGTNAHSIWLVTWDEDYCYGIYPKGSMAGLQVEDHGKQRVLDSNSKAFWAYVTQHQWKCGIAVEDYRYLVRYQWDPDEELASEKTLYLAMIEMLSTIYIKTANTRFYMDRTSYSTVLQQLASNDANFMTYERDQMGMPLPEFLGVPVRVTDALTAETWMAA